RQASRVEARRRPGDDPQLRGRVLNALARADASRPGYDACTGCNLCVLPCPVFRDTRDLALTLRGRAKALQAGATIEEIRPSLAACVTCGACEPVCPEDIDTVG